MIELYRDDLGEAGQEVLPAQDGLRALARADRAATPVIVVCSVATGQWALRVGAHRFVQKPFRRRQLEALVDELLGEGPAASTR